MTTLRLLLGDQLNDGHSWFSTVDDRVVYVMIEMRQETDYVLHHAQKVIAVFAAMRAFADRLRGRGHRVHYLRIGDPRNTQDLAGNLEALLAFHVAFAFEYQAPDEWRLDDQLARFAGTLRIPVHRADTEHFLGGRDDATTFFGEGRWLLERFYRWMRVRHRVLVDANGRPVGGRWNYDSENRSAWKGSPPEPADARTRHDHSALWQEIQAAGVRTFGEPCAARFPWPLDREEALADLRDFVSHRLANFGRYQDAMHADATRLFHSLLSFALNVKLLSPREVVDAAVQAFAAGRVDIAACEGFVRQILGWREYVRGYYWSVMPGYEDRNAFGHAAALPAWFWTGATRMECLRSSLRQSLDHAHAHHIQRLMVIGNFALLAGIDPHALHRWYLGVYIDAFEWVELPNTLGLSQYADGGRLASKPYVSTSGYMHRMSNYCSRCPYDRRSHSSVDACPFNALYWDFFARHRDALEGNPRLQPTYRQLDHKQPDMAAIRARAADLVARLEDL
ncbi:cryptochrome/photolyase family protein [Dokdonella sp.]|uniref:cryptochrome/photolyase family protein n=1 Tax=Dokdonella sp. TaxID=2291710 RepID=UPI002F421EF6